MNTVLGLDLGTQSVKAVCYDYETQRVAAVTTAPLEIERDTDGKAEQHAQWWLTALESCLAQLDAGLRASIRAIAVSGQQHGFVPLARDGSVLAPVKLWCDTATQTEVAEITRACGGRERALALTGNPVLAGYTAPKIRWLKQHLPQAYAQLAHILLPHDYLNFVLTGVACMEYGDASGTGLLDVRTRNWSAAMLQAVDAERDLRSCLPPLLPPSSCIGHTTEAAALRFGLRAGIPVATGGGDNMMAAIGTGNVRTGELTLSLGSSGTLYAHSETPVLDPRGEIAAFCGSGGGWLPLLCTMNCTLATEQVRGLLDVPLADFDAVAGSVPAGAEGLLVLPFFNGERTPDLPNARASVHGLSAHNCSKAHLLRATLEATCYALKSGGDRLHELGLFAREITLTGGGSNSAVWRQAIADLFGLPVRVLRGDEGAAFGAALQALWVLRRQDAPGLPLAQVCNEHLHVDATRGAVPDSATGAIYAERYRAWRELVQYMTPYNQ
jgi:xylulokinase